jgi:Aconitate B N-terminal domain/Isocitrate/isopropylmalate dehydrogenase
VIYEKIAPPETGSRITFKDSEPIVPNDPIIPFIRGDGTGVDIWPAAQRVFDAAVEKAYGGDRKIVSFKVYASDEACEVYGTYQYLPEDTLNAIREYRVAIKGPLTTPIGGSIIHSWLNRMLLPDTVGTIASSATIPGIPSLPLSADQTTQLCELLKTPPPGKEAALLNMLRDRIPLEVNQAAYVKAGFLTAITKGEATSPLVSAHRMGEGKVGKGKGRVMDCCKLRMGRAPPFNTNPLFLRLATLSTDWRLTKSPLIQAEPRDRHYYSMLNIMHAKPTLSTSPIHYLGATEIPSAPNVSINLTDPAVLKLLEQGGTIAILLTLCLFFWILTGFVKALDRKEE